MIMSDEEEKKCLRQDKFDVGLPCYHSVFSGAPSGVPRYESPIGPDSSEWQHGRSGCTFCRAEVQNASIKWGMAYDWHAFMLRLVQCSIAVIHDTAALLSICDDAQTRPQAL